MADTYSSAMLVVVACTVGAWLVFSVGYRYLVFPLKMRGKSLPDPGELTPVELPAMPRHAAAPLTQAAQELAARSFVAAGHFIGPVHMDVESYYSIWVDDERTTVVRVIFVNPLRTREASLTFGIDTVFTDGSRIVTTNPTLATPFEGGDKTDLVAWRGLNRPGILWNLHRLRLARHRGGRTVATPDLTDGKLVSFERDASVRFFQYSVDRGLLVHDVTTGTHRFTTKGAFVFTWRMLWPWKQLRMAAQRRKLAKTLAEFPEVDQVSTSLPSSPAATSREVR